MKHVFTYGSLMFDEIWQCVVRGRYHSEPLELRGFVRKKVRAESYPALVKSDREEDKVRGRLYFAVNCADLQRLDHFEGAQYKRVSVQAATTFGSASTVECYLWRARYRSLLSRQDWDGEDFRRRGLQQFRRKYRGYLRVRR